ncbi:3-methyl-2-oxobutanoate hydroxymethyltransferase [Thiomicrospira cyclica]|uniref:3-methyl-2-oxobutanoate hydroxymethyltransferase n=1 Tax=Thiomicrospira cyclica (strain DSM 14477 / JCM 11371 / ALM1) TaxID=717773 RepID=F6D983_THICA|nr:3-methyl-2-oxobutanoate hydroxymethyltransferase [Thiomicrospira cyclica]AEG32010.1 3-methyl-2-oxobutanoate hydroxymethyltransferase [Thiomicrospira cyclica ALM1]
MKKTLKHLYKLAANKQPIACVTAYDAAFAHWANEAGMDVILVGDSLGMVVQGHATTLPVTLEDMVYHTQLVQRGNQQAWCVADLPFMADKSLDSVLDGAAQLLKVGHADMVKLEGGQRILPFVKALAERGVPVCGHLGLLPQSVLKKGYQVQGTNPEQAAQLLADAKALVAAGIDLLVLECVPSDLARQITAALPIPVIGIGAGSAVSGQVLVSYDVLGLTPGHTPKFSENFLTGRDSIQAAFAAYVSAVKQGHFPTAAHEVG